MFRVSLVLPCLLSEAVVGRWIWSVVPGKENGSECDTEACGGIASLGGVVLSSSEEVNACLRSVPASCSFQVEGSPRDLLTASVKTPGGDEALLVDLQSLNAADEVEGLFGWGGGALEVSLARPVGEDGCTMVVGYSSQDCADAGTKAVQAAQSVRTQGGQSGFSFSPGEVYRSDFKCLQVYPSSSWDMCGGAVTEVKFHTPRLATTELKGRRGRVAESDSDSPEVDASAEGEDPRNTEAGDFLAILSELDSSSFRAEAD